MRLIIYGAGGIGGVIGARAHLSGVEVVLVARGAHHAEIAARGLRFLAPDGTHQLRMPVVDHPRGIDMRSDDVVLLCMKSQHTEAALLDLRAVADDRTPIVCAQNGVANERLAARYFDRVYGMVVILPAVHLEPGTVVTHATGVGGILDLGCYPRGVDALASEVAACLTNAGFSARADGEIMRAKYAKLLMNLNNALQAAVGLEADARDIAVALRNEALAVYAAAGVDCANAAQMKARRADGPRLAEVEGVPRGGGSSWQSLARGAPDIETDFLNGEIALLGRLYGVPTPANATLQRIASELARAGAAPGALSVEDVAARIGRATAP